MPTPIEQSIELFQLNLKALEIREQYYDMEQKINQRLGWPLAVLGSVFGSRRQSKKGWRILKARLTQYRRAITELEAGRTDFAIIQLRQLARDALATQRRSSIWHNSMYDLPRPAVPSAWPLPGDEDLKVIIVTSELMHELQA